MQLIITTLGATSSGLFETLLASIHESACRIQECRMTRLAEINASFLLVEGKWNHIARLENALAALQGQVYFQRLDAVDKEANDFSTELLYVADIVTRESTEVLNGIVQFLHQRGVGIQDLRCSSYRLPYVGGVMCTIHLLLRIPDGIAILALRDEFLDWCEQLQVDAIFEPVKPII